MFIDDVMQEIWKPTSRIYLEKYKEYEQMDTNDLVNYLDKAEMMLTSYPYCNLNMLLTAGCSHHVRKGNMSGCSMCNYQINHIDALVALNVLRNRDVLKYVDIVIKSFTNRRGEITQQMYSEVVTGYNIFDSFECPELLIEKIFGEASPYKVRPFRYVVEARANDVTKENVAMLRRLIPKGRIEIEIGIETEDDWLRNHWLNKNVTNNEIKNAVQIMSEYKVPVMADIILGIPGLTEMQGIDICCKTIDWLEELGVENYTILPLNRRSNTLQDYLYKFLSDDDDLKQVGLVNGEHTGITWLFTLVEFLIRQYSTNPKRMKKISVVQYDSRSYSKWNATTYNYDRNCVCHKELVELLDNYVVSRDMTDLIYYQKKMVLDPCYQEYQCLLKRQSNLTVTETMCLVAEKVAGMMFANQKEKIIQFQEELLSYTRE